MEFENGTFSLAPVNHEQGRKGLHSLIAWGCSGAVTPTTTTSTLPTSPVAKPQESNTKKPTGVIIGAVIGGVAGVVIIAGATLAIMTHHRQPKPAAADNIVSAGQVTSNQLGYGMPELRANTEYQWAPGDSSGGALGRGDLPEMGPGVGLRVWQEMEGDQCRRTELEAASSRRQELEAAGRRQ